MVDFGLLYGTERRRAKPEQVQTTAHSAWTEERRFVCRAEPRTDIEIRFDASQGWVLDGERNFREVREEMRPPFPVGCFLLLRTESGLRQVDLPRLPSLRVRRTADGIIVRMKLRDTEAAGLSFWGEEKLDTGSKTLELSLRIHQIETLEDARWSEPWPGGARAVICLTDHADWDSTEKLRQLADLFERHEFRLTKSIFPHSDPQGNKREPGLDDPEFRTQVDRFYAMGTEIAYHGFGPRVEVPGGLAECRRRMELMDPYAPETWIDHGTGRYLYTRDARCGDESLTEMLAKQGIHNYWSYTDVWENPAESLDLWRSRRNREALNDVWGLIRAKGSMSAGQLAYLAAALPKNLLGGAEYRLLRQGWNPKVFPRLRAYFRRRARLYTEPMGIYDEAAFYGGVSDAQRWVFDTILLNHLALELRPSAIDRLVEENGVLVAHCYMGAQHRYGGSNCFDESEENPKLLKTFEDSISYMATLQKSKKLSSLSFRDLRIALEKFSKTNLIKTKDEWRVDR